VYKRQGKTRRTFKKGYLPNWTEELFTVSASRKKTNPVTYHIKDDAGEVLEGGFYEPEVQKVIKTDDVYEIEEVIKRRKGKKGAELYVKWSGYPPSFNSWIPESALIG